MTDEEKMAKLASVFDCEVDALKPDTALDGLGWDSMAMLTVISVARQNGKKITGADVRQLKTIADIMAAAF